MNKDTAALVERLRAWGETPFEGDPIIDALLVDVPAAADTIAAQQAAIEELMEALSWSRETLNVGHRTTRSKAEVVRIDALLSKHGAKAEHDD